MHRSCASYFQFLEKTCIFSLVLVKLSALKMQIFQIFVPKTPHFSRKICSLDPTLGNLCGTHPPKKMKSWVPPPPPRLSLMMLINFDIITSMVQKSTILILGSSSLIWTWSIIDLINYTFLYALDHQSFLTNMRPSDFVLQGFLRVITVGPTWIDSVKCTSFVSDACKLDIVQAKLLAVLPMLRFTCRIGLLWNCLLRVKKTVRQVAKNWTTFHLSARSPGGGGSHIDMVYVYVPAFWGTFSRNLV